MEYDRRYPREGNRRRKQTEVIPFGKDHVLERRVISEQMEDTRGGYPRGMEGQYEAQYMYDDRPVAAQYAPGGPQYVYEERMAPMPALPPPVIHREMYHDRPPRSRSPKRKTHHHQRQQSAPMPRGREAYPEYAYAPAMMAPPRGEVVGAYPVGHSYTPAPDPYAMRGHPGTMGAPTVCPAHGRITYPSGPNPYNGYNGYM